MPLVISISEFFHEQFPISLSSIIKQKIILRSGKCMCWGNQDDLGHTSGPLSIFGIEGGPKTGLLLALYIAGSPITAIEIKTNQKINEKKSKRN